MVVELGKPSFESHWLLWDNNHLYLIRARYKTHPIYEKGEEKMREILMKGERERGRRGFSYLIWLKERVRESLLACLLSKEKERKIIVIFFIYL